MVETLEEVYVQPMTPLERRKVDGLKKLKVYVEDNDKTIAFYKIGQEFGLSSLELSTIIKLGMVVKRPDKVDYRKFLYSWATGDPTRQMYKEIVHEGREYHKIIAKKSAQKKAEKQRRELETKRALREAESQRIKKAKLKSVKSEGRIFDLDNHDLTNTLKARCEGYTEESLDNLAKEYLPPQQKETYKETIPITVSVTTEGNRKTININILL